ncbi:CDP-glycerol glycerophosphotransferase family protein [Phocaeicola sp.]
MIIHNYVKFIVKCSWYLMHQVSTFVPRQGNKWVFGTFFRFYDNPKYLYFKVRDLHPEIKAIWISRNIEESRFLRKNGVNAVYWLSLKGLWHCLTAKVYISHSSVRDINPFLSGGAFYVNLWHGVGVKKIRWLAPRNLVAMYGLSSAEDMHRSLRFKIETYYYLFRKPDLCLVPSIFQARTFFAPMLDIPIEHCLLGNYPRNELMLCSKGDVKDFVQRNEPKESIILINKLGAYRKVYIYMPTWRNDGENFVAAARIDWNLLNEALKETNAILLLKLHPKTNMDLNFLHRYPNIITFPQECDVYTIFPFTDCLITDYSSVYSDYSLMNKEVILFVFDYDRYVKGSFELTDYDKYYPGTRAYNFKELLSLIENDVDCHVLKQEHDFIMETFWAAAFNGVDIVDEIKKRIGLS